MYAVNSRKASAVEKDNKKTENVAWRLTDIERQYSDNPFASVASTYVLYLAQENPGTTGLGSILEYANASKTIVAFVNRCIADHWDKYRPMLTTYSQEDLSAALPQIVEDAFQNMGKKMGYSSSRPISELCAKLLSLKPGDSVCDFGCAAGDFLRKAYYATMTESDDTSVTGVEISVDMAAIAEILASVVGVKMNVLNMSMFDECLNDMRFDKVMCEPPLSIRGLVRDPNVEQMLARAFPDFPEISGTLSGDWIFAARAVAAMKKNGKALTLLAPSVMIDDRNAAIRRFFISRNLVEAVIELPPNLLLHTSIQTYLVLFSEGNETVKMVRAEDLCYSNRRKNVLGKAHIDIIAACLGISASADAKIVRKYMTIVDKSTLLQGNSELAVKRYFADPVAVKDGVRLGELVEIARCGAVLTSDTLDSYTCKEETAYQYLTTKDIVEGFVSPELTNLREIPERALPFCAKQHDILVSRINTNDGAFRVAVIEIPEGKTIVPNANVLIVRVDKEKCDPYYIKACLDNEYAQRYLDCHATGGTLRTLSYRDLESLPIPNLPLEKQREIGRKCRERIAQVLSLKKDLADAKSHLASVFDEYAPDALIVNAECGMRNEE